MMEVLRQGGQKQHTLRECPVRETDCGMSQTAAADQHGSPSTRPPSVVAVSPPHVPRAVHPRHHAMVLQSTPSRAAHGPRAVHLLPHTKRHSLCGFAENECERQHCCGEGGEALEQRHAPGGTRRWARACRCAEHKHLDRDAAFCRFEAGT